MVKTVIFFYLFIYLFERGAGGGKGRQRGERENPKQALHHQHRVRLRAQTCELRDHDLSKNQELDSFFFFNFFKCFIYF